MLYIKKISQFVFFSIVITAYSQTHKKESLKGEFIYLLKAKLNNSKPDYIHEELFSLQITDNKSFFMSEKSLKIDSIFLAETELISNNSSNRVIDFRGRSLPKTKFKSLIIQTGESIKYYDMIGMTLLSYESPKIDNWKLINETKIINTIECKKAELHFKGRDWIAWYSTKIPLTYGPYKFGGLPGLIIKITDTKADYDFELVKSTSSSNLKGKIVTVNKNRYENSKLVTKTEFYDAKENYNDNLLESLESLGATFTPEQRENLRIRQKNRELIKKSHNPIELDK